MALGDPFQTTYEGSRQGAGALGEGIMGVANLIAQYQLKKKLMEREEKQKNTELLATLATKGLLPATNLPQEPQTIEDYQGLAQGAGQGLTADTPETAKRLLEASGIQIPKRPQTFKLGDLGEFYQAEGVGGNVGVFAYDPETKEVKQVGTIPKSSKIYKDLASPEREREKMVMKAEGQAIGEAEKAKAKVRQSKLTSQYNLNLTAEAAHDLSDWLVKGYKEGGAGTRYRAWATKAAAAGLLPQDVAKQFKSSGAIVGKRNEMLMKMFPMLTQQIGKEGSVRLIESVLERIGQTLPDTFTPDSLAREQLAGTLQSMYRISRALENVDLSQLDITSPTGQEAFIERVTSEIPLIEIDEKERETLDKFIDTSLKPLDKYLGKTETVKEQSIDENLVSQYMKKYPNRSREDIMKALQRSR